MPPPEELPPEDEPPLDEEPPVEPIEPPVEPLEPPMSLADEPLPLDEPLLPPRPPLELVLPVVSEALPEEPVLPAPAAPAYAEYSVLLNVPSLSASSDLNCCDRLLSFFASDLLILPSPFLSSCESPPPAPPLDDAPALPVLPLSDGDDVLLLEEGEELDPLAPVLLEPVLEPLLMSLLLLGLLLPLLLAPDWARAPNEASEADIAKVKMSFLFIEDLLHS